MNKTLLSTALVATLGALAFVPAAQAASTGIINITGKVIADTCTISVNSSATSTVTLPTVTTNALSTVGSTAGKIPFTIGLTGCDSNVSGALMSFSGSNVDTSTGNLNNSLTTNNSNVQVQLLNSSGTAINTNSQANAPLIAVANSAGSTTMYAQYKATNAAATAGLVSTSVNFTLTYQ